MTANLTYPSSMVNDGISCEENVVIGVIVPGIVKIRMTFQRSRGVFSSERRQYA